MIRTILLTVLLASLSFGQVGDVFGVGNSSSSAAAGPNPSCSFASGATSCVFSNHGLNTTNTLIGCLLTSGGTPVAITGRTGETVNSVTVTFAATAGAGKCVINGTGGTGPAGPTGATGATGSAGTAATIAVGTVTGLAAGASPTVSNAGTSGAAIFNFGIPAGATGATGPQGPQGDPGAGANIPLLSEDTSPDLSNDFLMSYDVSTATHKKVLLNKIGGASTFSDTTDFKLNRTSSTVISIGAATSSKPTVVDFGGKSASFASVATATLTSGAGSAYYYVPRASGVITVGIPASGMAVTCSGCSVVPGITGWPTNDEIVKIGIWDAGSGSWSPTGTDSRPPYSTPPLIVGGDNTTVTYDRPSGTVTISNTAGSTDAPKVICANTNLAVANFSTSYTTLATCTIPGGTLAVGDSGHLEARLGHGGGLTIAPRFEVQMGGSTQIEAAGSVGSLGYNVFFNFIVTGTSAQKGDIRYVQDATGTPLNPSGLLSIAENIANPITINILGRMTTAGAESIVVDWYKFTVVKSK